MEMIKLIAAIACLLTGMVFFFISIFGVNRFSHALNRIHPAAVGDTLGMLFVMASLIIWQGFTFVSFKLLMVLLFFWISGPVSSHMIARLEAETDEDLGNIEVLHK